MVIYQTLSDLVASCAELSPRGRDCYFESGVFSGCYVTGVPDGYFEHLEQIRSANKRSKIPEAANRMVNGTARHEDRSRAVARIESKTSQPVNTSTTQDISLHNLND